MGKDSPQAKVKDQVRATDQNPTGDAEPTKNNSIADAARDAWHWGRRKAEVVGTKVGETSKELYQDAKAKVQSPEGQRAIQKTREGAANAIETVGGNSDNQTVNQITKNARLIPGAGNVVNAAETLSRSGVTGIVRDGKGTVNKEVLIRGAVESAPISGDAARLKNLADRTGVTGTIVDQVQDQVRRSRNPDASPETQVRGAARITVDRDALIRGAVENAPLSGDAARAKAVSDQTGFTGRLVDRIKRQFRRAPEESAETQPTDPPPAQVQERQKVKR